ncbi:sigma-70 family RNA polymerase sigma factor [Tenacibaculum finnmarkense genomovar finnmarkense]|uniref:Sigma-70 family RNA polymerase sigma factor n=1 Tax=Tenacibaculum finnmarkense genomovar finnmarkense TaxID=1458503 RepID=A0AAP1RFM3_9FLAO|nr:sigma-70 family RNA polymerase sigma factor [Tenacibaculum finnmarkense]MBE7653024.1 sigma-70 family RNA polymerase sigma factor [Tenacibaculum finnmarkense genomovar finnmarkense]MBE7660940.1 sigma-70 family RNA polymerase sigma factor [Tenacibaculum finnmarkense genomovar finnmarkense]MBE7693299.1 sigma-70 family RNA polymerase sigma factor [Tenacibaculum finnmarkense genomovar finnmarkense]MBE7695325.1 sigma-70 family RNA polymerase sigma factor [Tenacibaculum finnmarkense genomovar finnm
MVYKDIVSDSVLVKDYINGKELAIELLIKRHQQRLYSFIYSKVQNRDTTEDLFQDTFIKVIKTLKKGNYNEEGKFLPWVMRISHNLIIDFFRKNNRMPKFKNTEDFDIFSVLADSSLNVENKIIKEQILADVKELLEELPEEQKEVLKMRIYNDMSFNEIAENTGVSINTALGRMRYALINMRKIIEKNNILLVN